MVVNDKKNNRLNANASENGNGEYTAEYIEFLVGMEAVRRRPVMYIVSTGPSGLHHLVQEITYNSID